MPLSLTDLRNRYLNNQTDPLTELDAALAHSNSNAGHNVYLAQDVEWSRAQARALRREDIPNQPLWGVPVSLKDCFDLAGFATSCGSLFYRERHGIAATDSSVATKLRAAGAILTGKTHLHQLAYGITGQSLDFGDCLQPDDPTRLTGGSSSGAAASLQEGSAFAAIGTDTGGSVRVPSALCRLSGYRSSLALNTASLWRGGYHLAASFDTIGWLYPHLTDGPLLASTLFGFDIPAAPALPSLRIGVPNAAYLHDAEPAVLDGLHHWRSRLSSSGAHLMDFDGALWSDAPDLFAAIQASEAAALHRGHFEQASLFDPPIVERLRWGASLDADAVTALRARHATLRAATLALFQQFDCLLMPCAPVAALPAAAGHTETRARLLRYTTPASLAGLPTVTLPCSGGVGLQLMGPPLSDPTLLSLSAALSS